MVHEDRKKGNNESNQQAGYNKVRASHHSVTNTKVHLSLRHYDFGAVSYQGSSRMNVGGSSRICVSIPNIPTYIPYAVFILNHEMIEIRMITRKRSPYLVSRTELRHDEPPVMLIARLMYWTIRDLRYASGEKRLRNLPKRTPGKVNIMGRLI